MSGISFENETAERLEETWINDAEMLSPADRKGEQLVGIIAGRFEERNSKLNMEKLPVDDPTSTEDENDEAEVIQTGKATANRSKEVTQPKNAESNGINTQNASNKPKRTSNNTSSDTASDTPTSPTPKSVKLTSTPNFLHMSNEDFASWRAHVPRATRSILQNYLDKNSADLFDGAWRARLFLEHMFGSTLRAMQGKESGVGG